MDIYDVPKSEHEICATFRLEQFDRSNNELHLQIMVDINLI